jgi:hypothetical protein
MQALAPACGHLEVAKSLIEGGLSGSSVRAEYCGAQQRRASSRPAAPWVGWGHDDPDGPSGRPHPARAGRVVRSTRRRKSPSLSTLAGQSQGASGNTSQRKHEPFPGVPSPFAAVSSKFLDMQ